MTPGRSRTIHVNRVAEAVSSPNAANRRRGVDRGPSLLGAPASSATWSGPTLRSCASELGILKASGPRITSASWLTSRVMSGCSRKAARTLAWLVTANSSHSPGWARSSTGRPSCLAGRSCRFQPPIQRPLLARSRASPSAARCSRGLGRAPVPHGAETITRRGWARPWTPSLRRSRVGLPSGVGTGTNPWSATSPDSAEGRSST